MAGNRDFVLFSVASNETARSGSCLDLSKRPTKFFCVVGGGQNLLIFKLFHNTFMARPKFVGLWHSNIKFL
jgi:hypothetical protein